MADISQICIARILNVMEQCGKKAISDKALYGKVKGKKVTLPDYKKAVSWLKERGDRMAAYEFNGYWKAENQMEWVRQMNACKAQAEEIVKVELIYD